MIELIWSFVELLIGELTDESKRQARVFLKQARELVAVGAWDEANMRLGLALKLSPNIADRLSKRQQRRLLEELTLARREKRLKNIQCLSDQLERRQKA